eukprot:COSAG01_NODE_6267_length_3763_cov_10.815502_4_plen_71_part_00
MTERTSPAPRHTERAIPVVVAYRAISFAKDGAKVWAYVTPASILVHGADKFTVISVELGHILQLRRDQHQ